MKLMANETCKDATVTANSATVNYPVTNVLDSRLSRIFKTDASTTATILFDAGSAVKVAAVTIANHNMVTGGTYKVQGNATNVWTSPTVDETITFASGNMTKQFTGGTLRYWRISIVNATNPDGFISIGRIWLGDSYTMPDISPVVGHTVNSNSLKSISVSGQSYLDKRYYSSVYSVKFRKFTQAVKAEIIAQFKLIDIGVPFFITFDEPKLDFGTVYVTIDIDSMNFNILRTINRDYETALSFVEEVK